MPFVSQAQRAKCWSSGDPDWNCAEWEEHTPAGKLPKRKKKQAEIVTPTLTHRNFTTKNPLSGFWRQGLPQYPGYQWLKQLRTGINAASGATPAAVNQASNQTVQDQQAADQVVQQQQQLQAKSAAGPFWDRFDQEYGKVPGPKVNNDTAFTTPGMVSLGIGAASAAPPALTLYPFLRSLHGGMTDDFGGAIRGGLSGVAEGGGALAGGVSGGLLADAVYKALAGVKGHGGSPVPALLGAGLGAVGGGYLGHQVADAVLPRRREQNKVAGIGDAIGKGLGYAWKGIKYLGAPALTGAAAGEVAGQGARLAGYDVDPTRWAAYGAGGAVGSRLLGSAGKALGAPGLGRFGEYVSGAAIPEKVIPAAMTSSGPATNRITQTVAGRTIPGGLGLAAQQAEYGKPLGAARWAFSGAPAVAVGSAIPAANWAVNKGIQTVADRTEREMASRMGVAPTDLREMGQGLASAYRYMKTPLSSLAGTVVGQENVPQFLRQMSPLAQWATVGGLGLGAYGAYQGSPGLMAAGGLAALAPGVAAHYQTPNFWQDPNATAAPGAPGGPAPAAYANSVSPEAMAYVINQAYQNRPQAPLATETPLQPGAAPAQ